ncbi:MAG: RluA family pseudouridine synthase [Clostridia bacterium]|nr:RluA family pseudouridine synthase [Clostridia bacterium]
MEDTVFYSEIIYENGPVRIIYEDNHIIAAEKPAGILSQGDGCGAEDLLSLIKKDVAGRYGKPGDAFIGLVHRLDRNTGGVMVFAKTSKAASRLSEQLRKKQIKKCYFALAEGRVEVPCGTVLVDRLSKDEKNNRVFRSKDGRECVLLVSPLAFNGTHTLVAASPVTGRTHQIRAQLAFSGHPLSGDAKYGGKEIIKKNGESFLGLWSGLISLEHPVKKERMVFVRCPGGTDAAYWGFDGSVFPESIEKMYDLARSAAVTEGL